MTNIKRARFTDLELLQPLFDQYREFYKVLPASTQSRQFLRERLQRLDSIILLASVDEQAAGFVQIYPSFSSVAMQPMWVLNDLFVAENFRRLGVARALMHKSHQLAKTDKIFSIKLATGIDNHFAKKLYDSLGYQLIEQFDHYSLKIKS